MPTYTFDWVHATVPDYHDLHERVTQQLLSELFDQPVMSNLVRPLYVERMIAHLLGSLDWKHVGSNWTGWDLENLDGVRIEVKQSAARQVWTGRPSLEGRRTKGSFDIAARSGYYADNGRKYVKEAGRPAHVYIFAWHPVFLEREVDQRKPDQWQFFVVPTSSLPANQRTISLVKLSKIAAPVRADQLLQRVNLVVSQLSPIRHHIGPT